MDNQNKWADKPEPQPEDYGFVTATTPEDQVGNWTIEGGEEKYIQDHIDWSEAQDDAAFQKMMAETKEGESETSVYPD